MYIHFFNGRNEYLLFCVNNLRYNCELEIAWPDKNG